MGLPSKLKNMNLFNDGQSYVGLVPEVSIPKVARKFEDYRGGGMDSEMAIDMGGEKIEFEWKAGGQIDQVYRQFGAVTHDAVQLRWMGAYQDDNTGQVRAVEILVRGRHQEIDPGTGKPGDDTEQTIKTIASYYRLQQDGQTLIEIDNLNMIFIVNGVDILAEQRNAIGL
ncbi:phage major tail tube protein [Sphingobium sp. SCG-1]|uniref:phage major tail tube protein n=1 Tax=Sphingobium sp. SCG-1 TaxID=2072936 RepID=UPI000CD6B2D3|nr:phage major tail tube protein [Sphingobium sp. SCG-1]AUW59431.1 phage major tail tube protein [Sphingobium sp. SCG-1]